MPPIPSKVATRLTTQPKRFQTLRGSRVAVALTHQIVRGRKGLHNAAIVRLEKHTTAAWLIFSVIPLWNVAHGHLTDIDCRGG
jgi:hypothetical protein